MNGFMKVAITAALLASLTACNDDDNDNDQPSEPSTPTGALTVSVGDTPVDTAEAVVVKFDSITVTPQDGDPQTIDLDEPKTIDLLQTAGGNVEKILSDAELDAGDYESLKLGIVSDQATTDSYIQTSDGAMHPLYVPDDQAASLSIATGFTVPEDGTEKLTIDFDLRKSVVPVDGQDYYELHPTLRMFEDGSVGDFVGTIAQGLISAPGCTADPNTGSGAAVYVYQGSDVDADDVGSETEPYASGLVTLNSDTGTFDYNVALLPEGTYTVSFTCFAADDTVTEDEPIVFLSRDGTITAGENTQLNFDN